MTEPVAASGLASLAWLLLALPAFGAAVLLIGGKRTDKWGGSAEARMRFPIEIVRRIREELGEDFFVMYRMSLLDLIPNGQTWEETVTLAHAIEAAGASVINTGIGWHEARVPTIVTSVPRAAWADSTLRTSMRTSND